MWTAEQRAQLLELAEQANRRGNWRTRKIILAAAARIEALERALAATGAVESQCHAT